MADTSVTDFFTLRKFGQVSGSTNVWTRPCLKSGWSVWKLTPVITCIWNSSFLLWACLYIKSNPLAYSPSTSLRRRQLTECSGSFLQDDHKLDSHVVDVTYSDLFFELQIMINTKKIQTNSSVKLYWNPMAQHQIVLLRQVSYWEPPAAA